MHSAAILVCQSISFVENVIFLFAVTFSCAFAFFCLPVHFLMCLFPWFYLQVLLLLFAQIFLHSLQWDQRWAICGFCEYCFTRCGWFASRSLQCNGNTSNWFLSSFCWCKAYPRHHGLSLQSPSWGPSLLEQTPIAHWARTSLHHLQYSRCC